MIYITEKQIRNRQAEILQQIRKLTAEYKGLQSLLPVPTVVKEVQYKRVKS